MAGDEPDVVRKMRVGQLHGAAITSVGLAEIAPHLLVLQAPGLFGTWDELDHVRRVMSDELEQMLADKGFRNLLWGDVGFNQVFSNVPVKAPSDLRGTKPWCWTQDGVYRAFYDAMGVQPVLVGVPEVLPSLQTGMIDGLIVAPLVSVSLQWFSRLKYMLDMKQSVTIGAVVITEDALQKLEEADRQVLYEVAKELAPRIQKAVRRDNERAVLAVRNAGIQIQQPDAASQQAWAEAQKKAADGAAGEVYPKELLERVRKAVTQYRSGS